MGDLVVRKIREMHQGDLGLDGSRHGRGRFEVNWVVRNASKP
jgi:hypothetical protein